MRNQACGDYSLRSLKIVVMLVGASLLWLFAGIGAVPISAHSTQVQAVSAQITRNETAVIHAPSDVYTTYLPFVARPATVYLPLLSHWDSRYVQPGTYTFGFCHDSNFYDIPTGTTLAGTFRFCVDNVEVRSDFYMQFNVSWTLVKLYRPFNYAVKYSDYNNRNMNVTDNLGCRYDHVATGDAAATDTYFHSNGETHTGWFLFPPACLAATNFTFHDDDQHFAITDLVLGYPPYDPD